MLDLAIAVDIDRNNNPIVETNSGDKLVAPRWPQDCEFQAVSYRKGTRTCRVVYLGELSKDIGQALALIERTGLVGETNSDWFIRLQELADI
jgi:hypothetical protein